MSDFATSSAGPLGGQLRHPRLYVGVDDFGHADISPARTMCSADDVLARPALIGVTLTDAQAAGIPGYIAEASVLIEGYLGHAFAADDSVPDAARLVCARVVARALTARAVNPNTDRYDATMGPFTATAQVTRDALGGGVWLMRQDKMALDLITGSGPSHVPMFDLGHCPPAPDGWWVMTPAQGG